MNEHKCERNHHGVCTKISVHLNKLSRLLKSPRKRLGAIMLTAGAILIGLSILFFYSSKEKVPGFAELKVIYHGNRNKYEHRLIDAGSPRDISDKALTLVKDSPTYSPDGSQVAFVAESKTKKSEIYIFDNMGKSTQISTNSHVRGQEFSKLDGARFNCKILQWSPNGKRIAYLDDIEADNASPRVYRAGGLSVIHADGSGMRQLTKGVQVYNFTWAPDGNTIALVLASDPEFDRRFYHTTLSLINSDGSGLRILSKGQERQIHKAIVWSPKGDSIAFLRNNRQNLWSNNLCIIKADGTGEVELIGEVGAGCTHMSYSWHNPSISYNLAWNLEGNKLYYKKFYKGNLTEFNIDTMTETVVVSSGTLMFVPFDSGRIIYYIPYTRRGWHRVSYNFHGKYYIVNSDGGRRKRIATN